MLGKTVAAQERRIATLSTQLDSLKAEVARLKRVANHRDDYGTNMQPAIDQLVAEVKPRLDQFLRDEVKPALMEHYAGTELADGIYEQMDDDAVATLLAPLLIAKLTDDADFRSEFITALATAIYEDDNLDLEALQEALAEVISERLQVTFPATTS